MTTRDEVMVRIGVDHSGVAKGMKSASAQFKQWGKDNASQFGEQSSTLGFLFENSFRKTFKALKSLVAINLISLGANVLEYWGQFTKALAAAVYNEKGTASLGRALERDRQMWHKLVKERDQAKAEAEKAAAETAKHEREAYDTEAEAAKAALETHAADWGDKSEKTLKFRKDFATQEREIRKYALDQAKLFGDRLQIAQAEVAFEKAKLELIKAESAIKDQDDKKRKDEIARQNAINQAKRKQITDILGSGAFAGDIAQMNAMKADMELSLRFGNVGRARTDQQILAGMSRSLQQRIGSQLQSQAQPQDPMVKAVMDAMAPLKDDKGLPVRVMDSE